MNQEEITQEYSLHEIKEHSWNLKMCSAIEGNYQINCYFFIGTGIKEGLDWLTEQLVNNGK